MSQIAVATTSQLAADAAEEVAAAGGNAVDCALAAALMSINTEPSVCALGGSAYITIWRANNDPVTIDGNVAVPGAGLTAEQRGRGAVRVTLDYGGGITTLVGPGSIAVPGTLAAMELAWKRYGGTTWATIFAPAIRACRNGFPLSAACRYYLGYSASSIFNRSRDGFAALHHADRTLLGTGEQVIVPHLADSLAAIAEDGARVFYEGDIAAAIANHCRDGDGMLTADDLKHYRAIERAPLIIDVGDWSIAGNPPPAVGGSVLAAMLLACSDLSEKGWTRNTLRQLVDSQRACLDFRQRNLDLADDVAAEAARLLESARSGRLLTRWTSASTVHTSVVDGAGTGCAITASSGYGSGEMPDGTGLWLNNCLGEIELNRRGLEAGPPGSRLPSNMAPSVARRDGSVLAVGSPGADRITTALQQFLMNYMLFDMPLRDAIAHPRVHVDTSGDVVRLMAEPGLDLPEIDLPLTVFPELVMYFGGVAAAVCDRCQGFDAAADPRREGGVFVSGT
ncbi:MAG: gamma-glutamyltransferase family protein [Gammaproteobacteria bacterium]|nr:gamma-glutamyltransferase family protein [Gammaproteobacteria bacterium]MBU2678328.1 gamma-glutamyltransferase family protein [Gammaproteobacteria bacterium]NNC56131.1 gamma-glutamyltransferase [Woeseiaceae bacterium]NNL52063.1 gamma-glutamyltransferase [Woeseiaceae bacterium]